MQSKNNSSFPSIVNKDFRVCYAVDQACLTNSSGNTHPHFSEGHVNYDWLL